MRGILYGVVALIALLGMCLTASADQTGDEIAALKERIIQLQNQGKLGIDSMTVCSKILGYGSYVPRENAVFKKSEELLLYYEPTNWFINKIGTQYSFHITQDLIVEDAKGAKILSQDKFLNFQYSTSKPVFDFYVKNSLSLEGADAGKYTYKIVLRDELGDKKVEKTFAFEVVP